MSTPDLDRAARDLCTADTSYWHHEQTDDYPCSSCVEKAQTAVSAALHDPDKGRDPVAEALCSHDESVHHMERTDDFPCSACVSAADAVRAAILGEAS
ncbi:hypothetical protein RDI86_02005 [Cellulosimicrobium sp. XJ-DQ-B-000]|uniref:hypothetical protein n=1 Tax=Cellulosimicrobium sp. XJ-DQ-B-000 TaxID=3072182 RepID=UPI0028090808|nr:hypothetical protein [Cellulosimicrobium sp. XJ-DQ-B-000]MDQ8040621.1 hypothetical protein [Cellulosimicrobium sp. XJ-DQ-B-000]